MVGDNGFDRVKPPNRRRALPEEENPKVFKRGLLPKQWPTRDDMAEINFTAIVATGRAILSCSPGVRTLGDACHRPDPHDTNVIDRHTRKLKQKEEGGNGETGNDRTGQR